VNLTLNRQQLGPKSTLGELLVDGAFVAFSLEDRYRPPPEKKVPGETCIPCGRFEVVITHSPRFGVDMPLLLNVPDFSGVRIHAGNTPADSSGCILVGKARQLDKVLDSRTAYAEVFQRIQAARARGELVFIDVQLATGGFSHAESA
jgi:hypothetical protein